MSCNLLDWTWIFKITVNRHHWTSQKHRRGFYTLQLHWWSLVFEGKFSRTNPMYDTQLNWGFDACISSHCKLYTVIWSSNFDVSCKTDWLARQAKVKTTHTKHNYCSWGRHILMCLYMFWFIDIDMLVSSTVYIKLRLACQQLKNIFVWFWCIP